MAMETLLFVQQRIYNMKFHFHDYISGGVKAISRHTFSLARYFHHELAKLKHSNGAALVEIYCASDFEDISIQGGIVCFNLKRSDGSYIGCSEVCIVEIIPLLNSYRISYITDYVSVL